MSIGDIVKNGGVSIHQFGPQGGYTTSHIYNLSGLYTFDTVESSILTQMAYIAIYVYFVGWLFKSILVVKNKNYISLIKSFALITLSLSFLKVDYYRYFIELLSKPFIKITSSLYSDGIALDGMFGFESLFTLGAIKGVMGEDSIGVLDMGVMTILEILSQWLFLLVFWVVPYLIKVLLEIWILVGPLCLAMMIYPKIDDIAWTWLKVFFGGLLAFVMQCIVFITLTQVGFVEVMAAFKSYGNPFFPMVVAGVSAISMIMVPKIAFNLLDTGGVGVMQYMKKWNPTNNFEKKGSSSKGSKEKSDS